MARIAVLEKPKQVTISIETAVHAGAVSKAKALGIRGGFSEYVARLIARDRKRKGSAALGISRHARARQ